MKNPNRSKTVALLLLAYSSSCAGTEVRTGRERPRPNILFIYSDDHARQAIGAYGSPFGPTPNLDRLAAEGMRFDSFCVGNSICAPARASVLTGKHSHLHGVIDNGQVFDGSQTTFPKLLQAGGYETALIGKWHLKSDPTGFDHWEVLQGQGPYYNPPLKTAAGVTPHEGYTTDIITDHTLEWLSEGRDESKPFMLMMQHKAPHRNWQPAPRHLALFDDVELPEPATLFDDGAGRASGFTQQEMSLAKHFSRRDAKLAFPGNLTGLQRNAWERSYGPKNEAFSAAELEGEDLVRWRYQRYVKDYMRCIHAVDESVGRVLDWLEESGMAEDTVVVYTSDQGFYLGEHGWYDKRWMYEESFRTPLIVRWPGVVERGSVDASLAQNIDLAPTLLDMAQVEAPAEMQGISMLPLLEGEGQRGWRDSVYYHYYEFPGVHAVQRHLGIATERYKLIHYYQLGEWELFDLERDPSELNSVWADEEYAEVRADLEARLVALGEELGETDPGAERDAIVMESARLRTRALPRLVLDLRDESTLALIDPLMKPFAVGARVNLQHAGIAVSMGSERAGFVLYFDNGRASFCLRDGKAIRRVESEPLEAGWHDVVGVIREDGRMALWIDGLEVDHEDGRLLRSLPVEGARVGEDPGVRVGNYRAEVAAVMPGIVAVPVCVVGSVDETELARWSSGGSPPQ